MGADKSALYDKKSDDETMESGARKEIHFKQGAGKKYFALLEKALEQQPCDHTLRHTEKWLAENVKGAKTDSIIEEIKEDICLAILEALPEWFEIPESRVFYTNICRELPFWQIWRLIPQEVLLQ